MSQAAQLMRAGLDGYAMTPGQIVYHAALLRDEMEDEIGRLGTGALIGQDPKNLDAWHKFRE